MGANIRARRCVGKISIETLRRRSGEVPIDLDVDDDGVGLHFHYGYWGATHADRCESFLDELVKARRIKITKRLY